MTLIDTTRFGRIEIAEEELIQFPRGLYGLAHSKAYCLIRHGTLGCFQWLQAADAPAIALVVTDPFQFFPEYQVEIPDPAVELLKASISSDVAIYTTLTIVAAERRVYTNLLGPLAINHGAGVGVQIILDAASYQTRHELPLSRWADAHMCRQWKKGARPSATAHPTPTHTMLVIARKIGQTILLGDEIEITVAAVRGDQVRLAIQAPRSVSILRKETVEQVKMGNAAAVDSATDLLDLLDPRAG